MLNVQLDNITVNPQRTEAPVKTFASSDVPSGTDSVIYKAAKALKAHGAALTVPVPEFTKEEKETLVADKKASLSVAERIDGAGNKVLVTDLSENQFFAPTEAEIDDKYLAPIAAPGEDRQPKKSTDIMKVGQDLFASREEARQSLIDEKAQQIAEREIDRAIGECLIVPELSEEFKAQFTTIEL